MKKKTEKKRKPRLFIRNTNSGKDREIFGKKQKTDQKKEFPSIYRRITDQFNRLRVNLPERISRIEGFLILKSRVLISLMISLALLSLVISAVLILNKELNQKQRLEHERQKITAEINYWQQVVGKYSNYRDGFFQLSVLEYKMGDKEQSRFYLQKVLELDPNFEAARKLEKLL